MTLIAFNSFSAHTGSTW